MGLGWNGMGWDKVMMDGRWEIGDGRWEMKDGRWQMGGGGIAETDALRLTRRLPSIPSSTNTLLRVDLCGSVCVRVRACVRACVRGVRTWVGGCVRPRARVCVLD